MRDYRVRIDGRNGKAHKLFDCRPTGNDQSRKIKRTQTLVDMASRRRGGRRIKSRPKRRGTIAKRRRSRRGGRGVGYETSSTRRRRTPANGRGIGSMLKGIGKFAARNAPAILKGARYLAGKSGNKTLKSLADSQLLDQGSSALSNRFGGRSASKLKTQARTVVRKLIRKYGEEGARKILIKYMSTRGRGVVGKVLGGILAKIFPFQIHNKEYKYKLVHVVFFISSSSSSSSSFFL